MGNVRKKYIKRVRAAADEMFEHAIIPTVGDFYSAYVEKNDDSIEKIHRITEFTDNTKDIDASVARRDGLYTNAESTKFMSSVIAANITDITESGYFYKKLISSCDDMTIDIDDCRSKGEVFDCPIDQDTFDYKIKNRYINELNCYVDDIKQLPKTGKIHVRTFLTCKRGPRHFCKKCAGMFKIADDALIEPKYIGLFSTLMITEHATQASLDSMNKGVASEKINVILEKKIEKPANYEDAAEKIRTIIDTIGNVGVESRFYEIALLSRYRNGEFSSLQNSFFKQDDYFGQLIYSPREKVFKKFIDAGTFEADSTKTKIAFDSF